MYRGDMVIWDSAATPTSITWDGTTLGANDFIFVNTKATTIAGEQAGLVVGGDGTGSNISNMTTTTAVCTATTGSLVVIQTWGVFDTHANTVDATVVAGAVLLVGAAAAGELTDAAAIPATEPTSLVAIALSADAVYTRGAVTTNTGVTAFVRCDF